MRWSRLTTKHGGYSYSHYVLIVEALHPLQVFLSKNKRGKIKNQLSIPFPHSYKPTN